MPQILEKAEIFRKAQTLQLIRMELQVREKNVWYYWQKGSYSQHLNLIHSLQMGPKKLECLSLASLSSLV